MIHVITKSSGRPEDAEFCVTAEGDVLCVTHRATKTTVALTLSELGTHEGGALIYWSKLCGGVVVDMEAMLSQKELGGYLAFARATGRPIASVVVNDERSAAAAVFFVAIQCEGQTIQSEGDGLPTEAADLVFPGISGRRIGRRAAKVDLLLKLGAHDSLSALEKQVDLLTQLVLDLARREYGSAEPASARALSRVLAEGDSTAGMSADEAAATIGAFKQKLREAQNQYFATRGA